MGTANGSLTVEPARTTGPVHVVAESAPRNSPAWPTLERLHYRVDRLRAPGSDDRLEQRRESSHLCGRANVRIDTGMAGILQPRSPRRVTPSSWHGSRTCATMTSAASTASVQAPGHRAAGRPGRAAHRPPGIPPGARDAGGRAGGLIALDLDRLVQRYRLGAIRVRFAHAGCADSQVHLPGPRTTPSRIVIEWRLVAHADGSICIEGPLAKGLLGHTRMDNLPFATNPRFQGPVLAVGLPEDSELFGYPVSRPWRPAG
jgi:hypothetical protein